MSRAGNRQAFQRGIISHDVWRFAVGDLPNDFTSVEIDGGDCAVGRLHERKTVHVHGHVFAAGAFFRWLGRIGAGVFTRTTKNRHFVPGGARNIGDVGNFFRRGDKADRLNARITGVKIRDVRFGIVRSARPVCAAGCGANGKRAEWAVELGDCRRREDWAETIFCGNLFCAIVQRGSEIDQVVDGNAVAAVGGRLRGNWLSWRIPFARDAADFD